ncbi:GIY-YIG nuclease family protein [Streptomyces sp. NPDC002133]|uniref:GIY-YIG nuclease family protein n=1 Tax=Streptomyces sp. NPDC002133 TaxID=3154409 RepID=UPI003321762B
MSRSLEWVYVIGTPGLPTVKIGRSVDVQRRLRAIQLMCPIELSVLWSCEGGKELEGALHSRFAEYRSHGEWFAFPGDPVPSITEAAAGLKEPQAELPSPRLTTEARVVGQHGQRLVDWDCGTPLDLTIPVAMYLQIRRAFGDTAFTYQDVAIRLAEAESIVRGRMRRLREMGFIDPAGVEPGAYVNTTRQRFTARCLPRGVRLGSARGVRRQDLELADLAYAYGPAHGNRQEPLHAEV